MTTVYRVQNERGAGAYYGGAGVDATNALNTEEWELARRFGPMLDFRRIEDHARGRRRSRDRVNHLRRVGAAVRIRVR